MTHVVTDQERPSASSEVDPGPRQPVSWRRRSVGLLVALLAVTVVVLLGAFVVEPVRIGSNSMSPTLEVGQRVLIDKATYRFRAPHDGELIAFHAPRTGELTVKRVVGVGGDRVAIRDGVLFVNGDKVHEPYVDHAMVDSVYFGPVVVPLDTVFVMGDNRGESIDSRVYGAVPRSDVIGRVIPLWKP